jgi:hypothetical protein
MPQDVDEIPVGLLSAELLIDSGHVTQLFGLKENDEANRAQTIIIHLNKNSNMNICGV